VSEVGASCVCASGAAEANEATRAKRVTIFEANIFQTVFDLVVSENRIKGLGSEMSD